eukprot:TRINITY_DN50515_c0_g1_i1.p1 TRINITY_DN50515_c0_g1~~TRINITY_DN50515_c0_g1_i1.p1  ORF type:complete len:113 (+),score=24.51 TRINITY_DN50515_c0_g1_i1:125-463(+)
MQRGLVGSEMCIRDRDEIIEDIKFKTFGCGSAIAASSIATVIVKGQSVKEALQLTNKQVVDALGGLPPVKVHCSVLAEQALKAAIYDYAKNSVKNIRNWMGLIPMRKMITMI